MNLDLKNIPLYYINMEQAVEKRSLMEGMLSRLKFNNATRLEGVKGTNPRSHDSAAAEGCAASHLKIMKSAKPPFIILEDDAVEKKFRPHINIPDNTDVLYLGNSSWGRLDGRSGPFVHLEKLKNPYEGMLRIYNMLSTHAMLFVTQEAVDMFSKIALHFRQVANHLDMGYAEIHKYFHIYAFDDPMFFQSSSSGTDHPLTSYLHYNVQEGVAPGLITAYGLNDDHGYYMYPQSNQ